MMDIAHGNYSTIISTKTTHSYLNDVPDQETIVIVNVCADAILGCFVICGNLLILAVTRQQNPLSSSTNMLVASLAWADLSVGLIFVPTSMYRMITPVNDRFSYVFCAVLPAIWGVTAVSSILSMVGIGVERYRAIVSFHKPPYTVKQVKIMLAIIWGTALLIALPRYLIVYTNVYNACGRAKDYIAGRIFTLLVVSIASALMILLYWNIVKKLKNQHTFTSRLQQRRRTVMSFVVCVLWLIICFVPMNVYILAKSCVLAWNNGEAEEHVMTPLEDLVYSTLTISNSLANPIIYGIYNKRMRYDTTTYVVIV